MAGCGLNTRTVEVEVENTEGIRRAEQERDAAQEQARQQTQRAEANTRGASILTALGAAADNTWATPGGTVDATPSANIVGSSLRLEASPFTGSTSPSGNFRRATLTLHHTGHDDTAEDGCLYGQGTVTDVYQSLRQAARHCGAIRNQTAFHYR